jgi:hypothetical protein
MRRAAATALLLGLLVAFAAAQDEPPPIEPPPPEEPDGSDYAPIDPDRSQTDVVIRGDSIDDGGGWCAFLFLVCFAGAAASTSQPRSSATQHSRSKAALLCEFRLSGPAGGGDGPTACEISCNSCTQPPVRTVGHLLRFIMVAAHILMHRPPNSYSLFAVPFA